MRTRRSFMLLLLIPGLILAGILGISSPAAAYCDAVFSELGGRCNNACTFTARAVADLTNQPVPWDCPM